MTARRAAKAAVAPGNAAQSARDQAVVMAETVVMAEKARAAQERAEEAEAFAREHARGAQESITRAVEPELAARAERTENVGKVERDIKESEHPLIGGEEKPTEGDSAANA